MKKPAFVITEIFLSLVLASAVAAVAVLAVDIRSGGKILPASLFGESENSEESSWTEEDIRNTKKEVSQVTESSKEESITFKYITTEKIDQNELQELFDKYPPLDDGIEVEVRSPAEFSNKVIYFGEWDKVNNLRHGRGIQIWPDGAKFLGCWKNGRACGKGKLIHSDGDIYEGDWKDDKPWGYGKYLHLDGTKYEGEWKDDKQHGKGKEIWPDGTSYEGEYVEGKKQGKGIFKWHDKSMYEGEFLNSNIHCKGKYIFADGREYD